MRIEMGMVIVYHMLERDPISFRTMFKVLLLSTVYVMMISLSCIICDIIQKNHRYLSISGIRCFRYDDIDLNVCIAITIAVNIWSCIRTCYEPTRLPKNILISFHNDTACV